MSPSEIIVEGTLNVDGTLTLDEKPNLPVGRVQLIIQAMPQLPKEDPFWDRMRAVWAAQKARGHEPCSVEEVEQQRRQLREESAKRQEAIEQIQEESRRLREQQS
jgi:hypothetical protein